MEPREEDQARHRQGPRRVSTTGEGSGVALDLVALDRWMVEYVPDYAGPLSAERFSGGQSNPTFKLTTPGSAYVLRRKPPGPRC